MFHLLGVLVGSSPLRALNLSIFLIRLGGGNLGPRVMQASALCPVLPQNSQIVFCKTRRSAITGWIVDVSLLVEDEVPKL